MAEVAQDVPESTPRRSRGRWIDSARSDCRAYAGGVEGVVVTKKATFLPNLIKLLVLMGVAAFIARRAQKSRAALG
jgi:hypothetical protein